MPIEFSIDRARRRISTRASGRIQRGELVDYYRRLRAQPDFHANLDELFDLSEASVVDVTGEDVRELSATTLPFTREGKPVKVAIVAPRDLEFGMSRMYQMLQGQSVNLVRIFRDRVEADAWLEERADG